MTKDLSMKQLKEMNQTTNKIEEAAQNFTYHCTYYYKLHDEHFSFSADDTSAKHVLPLFTLQ